MFTLVLLHHEGLMFIGMPTKSLPSSFKEGKSGDCLGSRKKRPSPFPQTRSEERQLTLHGKESSVPETFCICPADTGMQPRLLRMFLSTSLSRLNHRPAMT